MILLLLACTGAEVEADSAAPDDDTGDGPVACDGVTETGTLTLSFAMNADYIPSMEEGEEPKGTVYGAIFDFADMNAVMALEDVPEFASIERTDVDLTGGGPDDVTFVTDPVPACSVIVVGCLDSDANGCEKGDPSTVPPQNVATVEAGGDVPFQMYFGLLNPG